VTASANPETNAMARKVPTKDQIVKLIVGAGQARYLHPVPVLMSSILTDLVTVLVLALLWVPHWVAKE
jgi:hypothetical protein